MMTTIVCVGSGIAADLVPVVVNGATLSPVPAEVGVGMFV
jgi:hypothetical protein